jgi:hypothetical protein
MLQGYFSSKILRELSIGTIQTLIGSIFFILSPTVIEKMFRHTALGGHWIILVAIYMFVRHGKDYENILKTSVVWGIIGFLIAGIHLYYLPMCGMFLFGYILCSLIKVKSNRFKCMLPGFSFLVNLLINTYILGGFSTPNSATADGLGECSFNLNGFFNAKGYSRVFDSLPMYFDSQYEGFSYLGLGIFVLILISILYAVICVAKSKINLTTDFVLYGIVYILMSLGLILFAASPIVTWNDKLLFEYPYSSTLYHYWSIFRSTGRMIWPVCYLIYIAVIVGNSRVWKIFNAKESVATIVLGTCLALQMFDLSGKISEQRGNFESVNYQSTLQSDVWTKLSQFDTIEHVVWVSNHYENNDMIQLARYADANNWTMNNFYFARGLSVLEYTKDAMQNLNDKCVYVFNQDEPTDYDGLYLYEADGYIIGLTFEIE